MEIKVLEGKPNQQQRDFALKTQSGARLLVGALVAVFYLLSVLPAFGDDGVEEEVESSVCVDCHDEQALNLKHTLHADAALDLNGLSCVSCHSGASVHIEDPSTDNITNPSRLDIAALGTLCSSCHMPHNDLDGGGFNAHVDGAVGCLDCHSVHSPATNSNKLLIAPEGELCLGCHSDVEVEFDRRSRHPVSEGNVLCLSCHDFTGQDIGGVSSGSGGMCGNCHAEHTGPFPYEHEATVSYTPEAGGCLECHNPHGSEVNHLLKERNNDVCLQCHIEPPKHQTEHGGLAKGRSCVTCHSEIHGSFSDKHFLPSNLQTVVGYFRDCFEAACHPLDEGGG